MCDCGVELSVYLPHPVPKPPLFTVTLGILQYNTKNKTSLTNSRRTGRVSNSSPNTRRLALNALMCATGKGTRPHPPMTLNHTRQISKLGRKGVPIGQARDFQKRKVTSNLVFEWQLAVDTIRIYMEPFTNI